MRGWHVPRWIPLTILAFPYLIFLASLVLPDTRHLSGQEKKAHHTTNKSWNFFFFPQKGVSSVVKRVLQEEEDATPAPSSPSPTTHAPTSAPVPMPTLMPAPAPTFAPVNVQYPQPGVQAKVIEVVINFGSIGFVMYLLKLLLRMAEEQIDRLPEYRLRQEKFRNPDEGQNWNWDFVLVTTVRSEDGMTDNETQRKYTMLRLVKAMHRANLETCQFKSQDWKKIIVKIRASAKRLKEQADKIDFALRLDEKEVKKRLAEGLPDISQPGEWQIYPRKDGWLYHGQPMYTAIKDSEGQCPYAFYEFMYGPYDGGEKFQALYQRYPTTSSIFRSVDRIKLILSILKASQADQGAGLALEKLIRQKAVVCAFPLHDRTELRMVQNRWLVYWAWPWEQPFDRIKDYFGEKVALYFVFLGHYTSAVMVAAVVGTAFYVVTIVDTPNSPSIPFFCVFMALWATLFVEFWKRKQNRYAMMWGMRGTESAAEVRPEFAENKEVVDITSPVTGDPEKYFPPASERKRRLVALFVIAFCGIAVLIVVVIIFFIKAILTLKSNLFGTNKSFREAEVRNRRVHNWGLPEQYVDVSQEIAGVIVALMNALQIFALENYFSDLAKQLTDYECHRTDTQYEDSLTGKVFIFQFINSFTSYMYIAFFKEIQSQNPSLQRGRGAYACTGSCMSELRTQLGAIFISKVILANVTDIALPYSQWTVARLAETRKKELEAQAAAERDKKKYSSSKRSRNNNNNTGRDKKGKTDGSHDANDDVNNDETNSEEMAEEENGEDDPTTQGFAADDDEEDEAQPARRASPAEEQMQLEEYNILLGPFGDYRDLVIIYGYTVLFVAAFPLAPTMALVNSYVQIRSDAWRISVRSRRPWPSNAEDIGTWSEIIELMSYLAVIINSVIIIYTGTFLDDFQVSSRLLVFVVLYHGLFVVKYLTALVIDDVPAEVQIQINRQNFVADKLLKQIQDDVLEVEGDVSTRRANVLVPDVTLHDADDDVVYLDYPGYGDNYKAVLYRRDQPDDDRSRAPPHPPSHAAPAANPPATASAPYDEEYGENDDDDDDVAEQGIALTSTAPHTGTHPGPRSKSKGSSRSRSRHHRHRRGNGGRPRATTQPPPREEEEAKTTTSSSWFGDWWSD